MVLVYQCPRLRIGLNPRSNAGQTLTINNVGELTTGIGFDGSIYVTTINDWINSIIPPDASLIFYDNMKFYDRLPTTSFSIGIDAHNYSFYYNMSGFSFTSSPVYPYSLYDSSVAPSTLQRYHIRDDSGLRSPYYAMERGWIDFPYVFNLINLTIDGIDYSSGENLTINNFGELTTGIGFDGSIYVTNIVDWLNSIIAPVNSNLILYDGMNRLDRLSTTNFNIEITGYSLYSVTTPYTYDNVGFSIGTVIVGFYLL